MCRTPPRALVVIPLLLVPHADPADVALQVRQRPIACRAYECRGNERRLGGVAPLMGAAQHDSFGHANALKCDPSFSAPAPPARPRARAVRPPARADPETASTAARFR